MSVLLLLPLAGAPLALFVGCLEKAGERRWLPAALYLCGAVVTGAAWLAAVGYVGYRAYRALP